MARLVPQPHLTEPVIVPCQFVEGWRIETRDDVVRFVGYIDLETVETYQPERRIVLRAAMPKIVARALIADLRKVLAGGGH